MRHRVVIVGGGFGGLYAAQNLKSADVDVTLIDRRNFHLFQPLLYQVATGGLSPAEIAAPLRYILKKQLNARVILAEVTDLEVASCAVVLSDGMRIPYDTLIVATGSTHSYFAHPEWAELAPGLKTIEDATEIRARILMAFERAELEQDEAERRANLTFVVVGGGPTGVELAGALGEISRDTLKHDFRNINPAESRIFLVEGSDRLLRTYAPELSVAAEHSLIKLGVQIRTHSTVTRLDRAGVTFEANGVDRRIETRTIIWAAGVQASPLGKMLATKTGVEIDRAGRVMVQPDLSIKDHPRIFVIGDLAAGKNPDGSIWPGVAPTAMQQGAYAAKCITARLRGETPKPFLYWNKGSLATIGRNKAVAQIGPVKFSGILAWLAWLFIHVFYIIVFDSRVVIVFQWAYDYLTFNRGARLITGTDRHHPETPGR